MLDELVNLVHKMLEGVNIDINNDDYLIAITQLRYGSLALQKCYSSWGSLIESGTLHGGLRHGKWTNYGAYSVDHYNDGLLILVIKYRPNGTRISKTTELYHIQYDDAGMDVVEFKQF